MTVTYEQLWWESRKHYDELIELMFERKRKQYKWLREP